MNVPKSDVKGCMANKTKALHISSPFSSPPALPNQSPSSCPSDLFLEGPLYHRFGILAWQSWMKALKWMFKKDAKWDDDQD